MVEDNMKYLLQNCCMKQPLWDLLEKEKGSLGKTNEAEDEFGECGGDTGVLVLPVAQALKGERTDLPLG